MKENFIIDEFLNLLNKEIKNASLFKEGDYPFPMTPEEGRIWQQSRLDTLKWVSEMLP